MQETLEAPTPAAKTKKEAMEAFLEGKALALPASRGEVRTAPGEEEPDFLCRDDLRFHIPRLVTTMERLVEVVEAERPRRILFLGKPSLMDEALGALGLLPGGCEVEHTGFDLRYPFPLETGRYDLIVNTEVTEHIKDQRGSRRDEFNNSGVENFFRELDRVLAPGGCMFLTTPNITSARSIARLLLQKPPVMYLNHVREYGPWQLIWFFNLVGLEVESMDTADTYPEVESHEFQLDWERNGPLIAGFLEANGFPTWWRGDTFFCRLRKPRIGVAG